MESILFHFPISGVETYWWLPTVVAFSISCFTSMGGISGAVLILPFQVSILGFVGPAVSSTNLLYNIIAIPGGVLRFVRDKRMVWHLAWTIAVGTLPGILVGAWIRVKYLPDPRLFKFFAGLVLAYIGFRLFGDFIGRKAIKAPPGSRFEVSDSRFTLATLSYRFNDLEYRIAVWKISLLSAIVGVVGGIYGIGGGAIIAPFLVAMFGLPVHSIAGVALFGTFVGSVAGVLSYAVISFFSSHGGAPIAPDWLLGLGFGVGGAAGIYVGARIQRFVSARVIKAILAGMTLFVAVKYITDFFRS